MKQLLIIARTLACTVLLVVLNEVFVVRLVGLSYTRFSWQSFAQVYDPNPGTGDMDGDGLKDSVDPHPTVFDPSGCFYDRRDGHIVPGGSIAVSGPPVITLDMDGSNGCYHFSTTTPGSYTIAPTLPPNCRFAADCVNQGSINPPGGMVDTIGNLPDPGNPGFLTSNACTPYFLNVVFDPDDVGLIGNNIALDCGTAAPALSPFAWLLLVSLLFAAGVLSLRRLRTASVRHPELR